jgi:phage terminase large subunit-like protein
VLQEARKKEERIESMEPMISTGQIKFKGNNELWQEMQDYPEAENLDVLDTLEMAWRLIDTGKFEYFFG